MATTFFRIFFMATLLILVSCSQVLYMECRRVKDFEPIYNAKIISVKDGGVGICKIRYRENKQKEK
jgi:hypothetical protein